MPRKYLEALYREGQTANPLFNTLRARLVRAEAGEAEIRMTTSRDFVQGGGMVAGGILATLADEAMAHAVLSVLPEGKRTVTSEMNIRYLRGATVETAGDLVARARLVRHGKHICVAEAQLFDSAERLLSVAGASFFLLDES